MASCLKTSIFVYPYVDRCNRKWATWAIGSPISFLFLCYVEVLCYARSCLGEILAVSKTSLGTEATPWCCRTPELIASTWRGLSTTHQTSLYFLLLVITIPSAGRLWLFFFGGGHLHIRNFLCIWLISLVDNFLSILVWTSTLGESYSFHQIQLDSRLSSNLLFYSWALCNQLQGFTMLPDFSHHGCPILYTGNYFPYANKAVPEVTALFFSQMWLFCIRLQCVN